MTHIKFLNDTSEFHEGLRLFKSILEKKKYQKKEIASKLKELLTEKTLERLDTSEQAFNNDDLSFYITSFSEENDLLSQWRSYGKGKTGVCIHLNKKELKKLSYHNNDESFSLRKCIYSLESLKKEINNTLDTFLHDIMIMAEKEIELDKNIFLVLLMNKIFPLIASFKNSSFKEEKEWRMIKVVFNYKHEKKFRTGPICLIPYLDQEIGEIIDFYRGVTVSPSQKEDFEISKISIEMLLNQQIYKTDPKKLKEGEDIDQENTYKFLNVSMSKIPYRG